MANYAARLPNTSQLPTFICRQCQHEIRRPRCGYGILQRRRITQNHIRKIRDAAEDWKERAKLIRGGKKQSMLTLLEERGYINQTVGDSKQLDQAMTERRVGFYAGVDPTAPSLHVGHMLPFMVLGWLYVHGYPVTFLLGGTTARVGDPTDRVSARPELHRTVRQANLANMHLQLKKLGDNFEKYGVAHGYAKEWAWKRELVNNAAWWQKTTFLDFLGTTGQSFRLGPMLGRDTVKNRLSTTEGMSFAEFSYPLMQAYDWWQLYQRGVQIQIGGADQYGNILAGAESIKYVAKREPEAMRAVINHVEPHGVVTKSEVDKGATSPYGFTVPLLTTSSGEKIGKSAGNAIWLDKEMTSVFDLYQYFLRFPDNEVERYLKLFTFLPLAEIRNIMEKHAQDPSKRVAQHALAHEFVTIVHGKTAAAEAEGQHRTIFKRDGPAVPKAKPVGDWNISLNKYASQTNAQNMESIHLKLPRSLVVGQPAHKIMWSAGMVSSKGEGHRLIANKGCHVSGKWGDDAKMDESLSWRPITRLDPGELDQFIVDDEILMLRIGKWKVKSIKIVSDEEYEASGLTCPGWKEEPEAGTEDWKELQQERIQDLERRKRSRPGSNPTTKRMRDFEQKGTGSTRRSVASSF